MVKETKPVFFTVRLSVKEYLELEELISKTGMNRSEIVRAGLKCLTEGYEKTSNEGKQLVINITEPESEYINYMKQKLKQMEELKKAEKERAEQLKGILLQINARVNAINVPSSESLSKMYREIKKILEMNKSLLMEVK